MLNRSGKSAGNFGGPPGCWVLTCKEDDGRVGGGSEHPAKVDLKIEPFAALSLCVQFRNCNQSRSSKILLKDTNEDNGLRIWSVRLASANEQRELTYQRREEGVELFALGQPSARMMRVFARYSPCSATTTRAN